MTLLKFGVILLASASVATVGMVSNTTQKKANMKPAELFTMVTTSFEAEFKVKKLPCPRKSKPGTLIACYGVDVQAGQVKTGMNRKLASTMHLLADWFNYGSSYGGTYRLLASPELKTNITYYPKSDDWSVNEAMGEDWRAYKSHLAMVEIIVEMP